jgi:3-oxoacyl-[acyl-carrier protein] reductase
MSRVVVVTGGNSGIGEACARKFAAHGCHVIICSRRETLNLEVCRSIETAGGFASQYQVDLCNSASLGIVFRSIEMRFGNIDCLVNSIGTEGVSFTMTEDYPDSIFDTVIECNLKAPWRCMKAVLPGMRKAKHGSIVNVSSLAGLRASATGGAGYTASKHALIGVTKTAAKEYASYGVRINAVCPAFVRTPMAEMVLGETIDQVANSHPINRICEVEEVADVVYWLCSPEASFLTGVSLPIDGGVTA